MAVEPTRKKDTNRSRAPTIYDQMSLDLSEWGSWSRNYIIGLGFKSSTIEHQIMSGEVFGDGNNGGGRSPNAGVSFKESERGERIDVWVRLLSKKCPLECQVLRMVYIMQWSERKIALKAEISRSTVQKLRNRGITLLLGMEASQPTSRP